MRNIILLLSLIALATAWRKLDHQPTVYIIGDSTVRNPNQNEQWGWGSWFSRHLDTTRISVSNQAMAGRSTRTFIKEGRWEKVINALRPGDFVIMQFGHNEGSKPDTSRSGYRGVLRGTGADSVVLTWPDGSREVVHSYGWYLSKFIREAKAKGATPIVASMIPRNQWKDGKLIRNGSDFAGWAKEVALREQVCFVDLNSITADKYDQLGADKVKEFFPKDHTHTNEAGAQINAASVAEGIRAQPSCALSKYLLPPPSLYLIGDSTVKNGRGNGAGGLWGWGDFIAPYFDTNRIHVENNALGGTSSRTFQTNGLWEKVLERLKPGDFVIMQFGHNDASPLDDTARARGTIRGIGDESKDTYNPIKKKQEVVYSYGWYLRKYIADIRSKGATAIVCSPIPRNSFKDGKTNRATDSYGGWAKQTAAVAAVPFIELNGLIADAYDQAGEAAVQSYFLPTDKTHTNQAGAELNAAMVVKGIRALPSIALNNYLK